MIKNYSPSFLLLIKQLFRYMIIGIFNTLIGLGTIYFFYQVLKVNYISSNAAGYSLGLINSFIWNKSWTFKSEKHFTKEVLPFLIVFVVSYLSNLMIVVISVETLKINPNISQLLGVGAFSITNFILNRSWTFSGN